MTMFGSSIMANAMRRRSLELSYHELVYALLNSGFSLAEMRTYTATIRWSLKGIERFTKGQYNRRTNGRFTGCMIMSL